MKKGQGATELLIILGVGLIVLLVILAVSSASLFGYSAALQESQAQDSLDEISSAAALVYQQGMGAKSQVYVVMPKDIANTTVSGKTLVITFNSGSQVHQNLDFNVSGTLPASRGPTYIDLEGFELVVNISTNVSAT